MSKQTEALKLALEFIEANTYGGDDVVQLMTAIREALAERPAQDEEQSHYKQVIDGVREVFDARRKQQPTQEPVAWKDRTYGNLHHQDFGNSIPLYTSPPARKPWVGLTDEEWQEIDASLNGKRDLARIFVGAIEAKLREKNV